MKNRLKILSNFVDFFGMHFPVEHLLVEHQEKFKFHLVKTIGAIVNR